MTGETAGSDVPERPDTDDYDLLTFGEVAARLGEELAAETAELERVRDEDPPDAARIRRIEERIELLRVSQGRYRRDEQAKEVFARRFGPALGRSQGDRPGDRPSWS